MSKAKQINLWIFSILFFMAVAGHAATQVQLFYSDDAAKPGGVYYNDGSTEHTIVQATSGKLRGMTLGYDGNIYAVDTQEKKIFRFLNGQQEAIYEYFTYIQDVAFDRSGNLYFSQLTATIFPFRPNPSIILLKDGSSSVYKTIPVNDLEGSWTGNFCFSPRGELFITTMSSTTAYIYKFGRLFTELVYTQSGSIGGFDFDSDGNIYFSDGDELIFKLDPDTQKCTLHQKAYKRDLSDVIAVTGKFLSVGPGAGRINCLAVHPTDNDILYAGSASGGVYRSYDRGDTWYLLTDGITDGQIGGIMVHPVNPETVYAVTQTGIFRSTNEGLQWSHVLSFEHPVPPLEVPKNIKALTSYPIKYYSGSIYAAPLGRGLYKSLDDGNTWTQYYGAGISDDRERNVQALEINADNGCTVYIGKHEYMMRDIGCSGTWSNYGGNIVDGYTILTPTHIQAAPSNPVIMYVAAMDADSPSTVSIWRRPHAYTSFVNMGVGNPSWGSNGRIFSMAVNPINPSNIYVGSIELFRSFDAGANFSNATCSNYDICGVDYRGLTFEPTGSFIYALHDQGIFRHDINTNGVVATEKGFNNLQIYSLDVGPAGTVYIGTQDKGAYRKKAGGQWESFSTAGTGDVLEMLADPNDDTRFFCRLNQPELFIGTQYGDSYTRSSGLPSGKFWNHLLVYIPQSKTIYTATQYASVYKSTNNGETFQPANTNIEGLLIRSLGNFPGNDQVVFAGTYDGGLYKTANGGGTWSQVTGFPEVGVLVIRGLDDGETVYAGTTAGVYVSRNGGATWAAKNQGLPTQKVVSELTVTPSDPACIYAGLGYYTAYELYGGGIYVSKDSGRTWSPVLPEHAGYMNVTSIRFDPLVPARIWVGTYGSGVLTLYKEKK